MDLVEGGTQRYNNRTRIRELLEPTREYCRSIGLSLDTAIINPINDSLARNNQIELEINGTNLNLTEDGRTKAFKALIGKDEGNLSDKGYIKMRKRMNFVELPTIDEIVEVRHEIDKKLYKINENGYGNGFYNEPIEKITKICSKFLSEQKTIENDTFILKLGGDGSNLTKSNTTILNLTFTIINDFQRAKSVEGNYSIGKLILKLINFLFCYSYYIFLNFFLFII